MKVFFSAVFMALFSLNSFASSSGAQIKYEFDNRLIFNSFSKNETQLAMSLPSDTTKLIDIATGVESELTRHITYSGAVKWSPSGNYVAALTFDYAVVFDAHTGMKLSELFSWNGGRLEFSPNERYLAVAGGRSNYRDFVDIFDLTQSQRDPIMRIPKAHGMLHFNHDSKTLVVAPGGITPGYVVDLESKTVIKKIDPVIQSDGSDFGIHFSNDDSFFVSADRNDWGQVLVVDVKLGTVTKSLEGSLDSLITPDSKRVVTKRYNQFLRVYDVSSGAILFEEDAGKANLERAVFDTSGRYLIIPDEAFIRILDLQTLTSRTVHGIGYSYHSTFICAHEDGFVRIVAEDGRTYVVNVASAEIVSSEYIGDLLGLRGVKFSPTGKYALVSAHATQLLVAF